MEQDVCLCPVCRFPNGIRSETNLNSFFVRCKVNYFYCENCGTIFRKEIKDDN